MISLTTDGIRTRERAEFWADLVSRHVTPIAIEPSRLELRGEIQAQAVGDVGLAEVSGRGIRAVHSDAHVGLAKSHLYAVCLHIDGETTITRDGETTSLRCGDVFITDSRRRFTLGLERPWRHLVLTLPAVQLDDRAARPEGLAGLVLRDAPLVRLWAKHLAAGFAVVPDLSRTAAALFARQSVDLLAQVLDESLGRPATPSGANRAAVFFCACHAIARRCRDSKLTPDTIAHDLGVSSRTLARAFAERNETVMGRVFAERLKQATTLLGSAAWAHRSITDIAFACGFNDVSHFGRVFAAKMQMTPSQYRVRSQVR